MKQEFPSEWLKLPRRWWNGFIRCWQAENKDCSWLCQVKITFLHELCTPAEGWAAAVGAFGAISLSLWWPLFVSFPLSPLVQLGEESQELGGTLVISQGWPTTGTNNPMPKLQPKLNSECLKMKPSLLEKTDLSIYFFLFVCFIG